MICAAACSELGATSIYHNRLRHFPLYQDDFVWAGRTSAVLRNQREIASITTEYRITENYPVNITPHVFGIYEDRKAWLQENRSQRGACPFERFLEQEESVQVIGKKAVEAGLSINLYKYSVKSFPTWIESVWNHPDSIIWNLTDGYDYFIGSNVPALARLLRKPHVGSGSYSQMLCQNKFHVATVAARHGIAVPKGIFINRISNDSFDHISEVPFPCFVKPAKLDNGIGDTIVHPICEDHGSIVNAVEALFGAGVSSVTVEEFLPGTEYSVAAINDSAWMFNISEIVYENSRYFSSQAKDAEAYLLKKPPSPLNLILEKNTALLIDIFDLKDYFRADFRCDADGVPRLLEIAIIHKELSLPGTLHRTLQLLSVHPFEKMPLHELLTETEFKPLEPLVSNQLLLWNL
jgi:D-alanine-D-alanine ligase-like ATP-grasp enzyme